MGIFHPKRRRSGRRGRSASANRRGSSALRRYASLGAAAVEFAIVANVLFILIMACIEFARLNMIRNLAQDAAYYGARHAVVPGATASEARAIADNVMSSMLSGGYTIDVQNINEDSTEVQVSVGVRLHEVALFVPLFLPDSTITTQAKLRTERYEGFFEQ